MAQGSIPTDAWQATKLLTCPCIKDPATETSTRCLFDLHGAGINAMHQWGTCPCKKDPATEAATRHHFDLHGAGINPH